MLPKSNRINSRQFSYILKKPSQKYHTTHLSILVGFFANKETRVGLIVKKNTTKGSSVLLHRYRRQTYDLFRELLPSITPGLSLIIIPKPSFFSLSKEEQHKEMKSLHFLLQQDTVQYQKA